MAVADAYRRANKEPQKPSPEPLTASETRSFQPLDIMLDGTFPRTVGHDEKVEYIPLTVAEEQELPDPEKAVTRMLAKALKYRIDRGLDTPRSAGLDETKSIEANVVAMLGKLPHHTRNAIMVSIQIDIADRFKSFVEFYSSLAEKYESDEPGSDRKPNKLDSFVMFYNNFKESGYTLEEVAKMTALQYEAFSLIRYEASIRQANDHSDMSARIKAKAGSGAGKGAKPKRQLVGS